MLRGLKEDCFINLLGLLNVVECREVYKNLFLIDW